MKTTVNKLIASIVFIFAGLLIKAQTIEDFLLFSTHEYQATARFSGMGGAFNALGGDFGTLSTNPAGIGMYRSSEISFTPAVSSNKTTTSYLGTSINDTRVRFGIANMGSVSTWVTGSEKGLVSYSFGLGYNKLMEFHKYAPLTGNNSTSSILDQYLDVANSSFSYDHQGEIRDESESYIYLASRFPVEQWTAVAAVRNRLVNNPDPDIDLYEVILQNGDRVNQDRFVSQSGSTGEYVFSAGANISNTFYFGATVGLQDLSFDKKLSFREQAVAGNASLYVSNQSNEYYHTEGTGVNLKLGAIFKPVDAFRVALAFHTPTWYSMESSYSFDMISNTGSGTYSTNSPYADIYQYRFQSPYRFEAGIACLIGKYGLISLDYELAGYKSMKIRDDWNSQWSQDLTRSANTAFVNSSNLRIGAEAFLGYGMMIRGGFNYYQAPYSIDADDFERYAYSGGIGYRGKYFFADFAYVLNTGKYFYFPHAFSATAVEQEDRSRIMLTLGLKF
ncbi:MAG: hypothetical protein LBC98_04665 [Prevotellaceae bacterium]|nr:hypothetical protein [Prevotellaceae bacterium]